MKRGFLNSEKARRKLAAEADIVQDKCKRKAKAETPGMVHTREAPNPPLLDLHSIPPSVESREEKKRFIFRHWPRDPNGKVIVPSDIHGKEAGNGLNLWGATLYDFYFVRRIPSNTHGLTISTGSKIAEVMKSFGELDFAQDELAWSSREADPREILAWDPAQAIAVHERRVHACPGIVDFTNRKRHTDLEVKVETDVRTLDAFQPAFDFTRSTGTVEAAKELASEDCANYHSSGEPTDSMNNVKIQPPSDIPVESPFHPSHYPAPWPLVPFESPCPPFPLQRGIPIHLLPKRLSVHDPWNLLNTKITDPDTLSEAMEEAWSSKTDRIHTYTLSLPPESQKLAEAVSNAAAATATEDARVFTIFPRETEGPTEQPAIQIFLPEKPRKPVQVPEAHLYLSPRGTLGTGNHSIVYEADLQLPRELFCESDYCKLCADKQIETEVDRLKESGEWERHLEEQADKYRGQHFASRDAASSSSAQSPPRYVGFVKVRHEHVPVQTMSMVAVTELGETPAVDAPTQHYARVSDSEDRRYVDYEGAVVPLYPNIQWQNPSFPETICAHQAKKKKPVPQTATFRVAVKLSLPGDPHLGREAANYLKFPAHFFQHWSGYNVVPPLHDPTPVGALVPQFFGYYEPDDPSQPDDEDKYLSPLLLLEHCGKPICVEKLSIDDRQECAALLFRFHAAGWVHGSFAERNILTQKRHPTCSPLEDDNQHDSPYRSRSKSFRLIDFGRSMEFTHKPHTEEMHGKNLFGIGP